MHNALGIEFKVDTLSEFCSMQIGNVQAMLPERKEADGQTEQLNGIQLI